jgi:hypothetical protein
MPARIVLVAEAVATAINAVALPIPVQAQMKWMPLAEREDMGLISCWAIPGTEAPSSVARGRGQYDCEILVALQKGVQDEAEISDLAANLEAIAAALFQRTLPLVFEDVPQGEAVYLSMRLDPLLDTDHWNRLRQYTGVLRITYRVHA